MTEEPTAQGSEHSPEDSEGQIEDRAKKSSSLWFWFMFVILVGAGAAAVTWPVWSPMAPPWLQQTVAELQGEPAPESPSFEPLSVDEPTLSAPAEPAPAPAETAAAAPEAASEPAVEPAVEQAQVAAETTPAPAVDDTSAQIAEQVAEQVAAKVATLQARIAALEMQLAELAARPVAAPNAKAQALVLAISQLQAALASEQPFAGPLASLTAIAADDAIVAQAIRALKPYAADGVPLPSTLAEAFDSLSTQALRAKNRDTAEPQSLSERVSDRLKNLIVVRRTDGATGDPVDDALANAAMALDHGDLFVALKGTETLPAGPAAVLADWRAKATGRMIADDTVANLHAHALSLMAGAE